MLSKEEYALDMEQRSRPNYAVVKDVQTLLSKEECALDMGHRSNSDHDAAAKDAQTKSSVEDCAVGMVRTAMHKTNLLHLDQSSR